MLELQWLFRWRTAVTLSKLKTNSKHVSKTEWMALRSEEVWTGWDEHQAWLHLGFKAVAGTGNISPTKGERVPRLQRGAHRKGASASPLTTPQCPGTWGSKAAEECVLRSKWSTLPSKNVWKGSASFCCLLFMYHCCLPFKESYCLKSPDTETRSSFPQIEEGRELTFQHAIMRHPDHRGIFQGKAFITSR